MNSPCLSRAIAGFISHVLVASCLAQSRLAFDSSSIQVPENQGAVAVTVQRQYDLSSEVSVEYEFFERGRSAAAFGEDYIASPGTLVFASAQDLAAINVSLIDDAKIETPETITIRLTSASAGVVLDKPNIITLTIHDDDGQFSKILTGTIPSDAGNWYPVACADYDNDGLLDLFLGRKLPGPSWLYHNEGEFDFARRTNAVSSRVSSLGASWTDYNNDGNVDLFVAGWNRQATLYRQDPSHTFLLDDSIPFPDHYSSVNWGDFDNDGLLDLFATPGYGANSRNYMYRNLGQEEFELQRVPPFSTDPGEFVAAACCDYDRDGDLDLFVAAVSRGSDRLYRNLGNGEFAAANASGVEKQTPSTAGTWADYDNDLDMDLFVASTDGTNNALYSQESNGHFTDVTPAIFREATGEIIGGAWGDYDNDGWIDLYLSREAGRDKLYRNGGTGFFTEAATEWAAGDRTPSTTAVWVDLDNNGFLDLVVASGQHGVPPGGYPVALYKNNGNPNSWIRIKCNGSAGSGSIFERRLPLSNRCGIGAKVFVKARLGGRDQWQMREITGGGGYHHSQPLEAHFGLGDAEVAQTIRIEWPSGIIQELYDVPVNRILSVNERPEGLWLVGASVAGDEFSFTIAGPPGVNCRIQGSADCVSWEFVKNVRTSTGEARVVLPTAGDEPYRFFRAVQNEEPEADGRKGT